MSTYNGWPNYETWCVALWIDNEEGTQRYWREAAQEAFDEAEPDADFTKREQAWLTLGDRLRDEIRDADEVPTEGMYADLLRSALDEVRWDHIAKHLLADIIEETT